MNDFISFLISAILGGFIASIIFLLLVFSFLPAMTGFVVQSAEQSLFNSFSELQLTCQTNNVLNSFIINFNNEKQYCIIEKQIKQIILDQNILG